jgi:hypothetical protein
MINIIRLKDLPEGSGLLSNDDILVFMDDPSGSGTTKKITFGEISNLIGSGITNPITIVGGDYISSNLIDDTYTISVTGLQPSGNYSLVGHTHPSTDIIDSTSFGRAILTASSYAAQNKLGWQIISATNTTAEPGGQYIIPTDFTAPLLTTISDPPSPTHGDWYVVIKPSGAGGLNGTSIGGTLYNRLSGVYLYRVYSRNSIFSASWKDYSLDKLHNHTANDITNFNSSVSGLLPSISGSGYVNSSFNNNTYTISVTGLQPSGNYSVVGHNHISTNITDFNSAVSGLLPVKNILSGTGINVNNASGVYTIEATGSGVLLNEAKSLVTTVFNKTGSPIPKMTAVYINGGQGDMPTISLAQASGELTSSKTYGLTAENISNMSTGKVIVFGALTGLDTDQFNPTAPTGDVNGTTLYLSPTVAGGLTKTKPSAPDHMVAIGTIIRTHQNEGIIEVRVQNGFELEELHNVAISGVSNGQFLQYNSNNSLWIPSSSGNFSTLSVNGTNVSISGHQHQSLDITDFNSAVSGLLPKITNSGNNRLLTSGGANTDINAETYLRFNDLTSSLQLIYDNSVGHTGLSALCNLEAYDNIEPTTGARIQLIRNRGTLNSPSGVINNDTLSVIRTFTLNASGVNSVVGRILTQADGEPTGVNLYTPTRMTFHTSSGPNQLDNSLVLYSNGKLSYNRYMIIEDGLSAPTPILSLGSVSGNVAINYDVDRQIQQLTLNGSAVNFTEGTGWDLINRSVDVMLEITVSSTTTVSFDKYLVLLRSMGVGIVQGHYMGKKTN